MLRCYCCWWWWSHHRRRRFCCRKRAACVESSSDINRRSAWRRRKELGRDRAETEKGQWEERDRRPGTAGHRRGVGWGLESEREARRRDRIDIGFIGGDLGERVEDLSRTGFTPRTGPMGWDHLHLLPVQPSISAGSTNPCGPGRYGPLIRVRLEEFWDRDGSKDGDWD
ncbi:hypothetical protein GW17_00017004 [Ensete ventricosum]|nr:hypothetical protein GW17_00017004 [Ensete ventricosum]RZS19654.1 hypothetical protein BHM03_00052102 [Ensete ventricosum]